MARATQELHEAPPRLRRLRLGLDITLAILVLILLLTGGVYWWLRASRSQVDGTLPLPGLQAAVQITRDEMGVPHITAANLHDLALAQGFAMAQDRLWQMDLMRRLGEGLLSQVFGPVALEADEDNRRLGLGRTAHVEATRLSGDERALLDAFAAGVNDNIAARGWRLPLEFRLLRYRPQPWRAEDSLALAAYMYQVLADDRQTMLERETFLAKLGPELESQLFPQRSDWDIVPGGEVPGFPPRQTGFGRRARLTGAAPRALPAFPAPFTSPSADRGGSNNWVLAPARSLSGQPILANDPHLPFQVPGLWWTVELTDTGSEGFSVAGVAIAGVPGVIIGHNQYLAWGVTNTEAGVEDLYRETLDGHGHVRTPAGWIPLQHWQEEIPVKGAAPFHMDIAVTPHGPIVAQDAGGPLALRWTMYEPGALQSTHVFLALARARNFSDFETALKQFPGPAQNFVYADRAGHIAYQCAGWIPVRHGFDGSVPVPGAGGLYEWQGMIPFSQLPHVEDPSSGIVATANGRITPDKYPYTISTDWDSPNRTREIYRSLSQLPRWNASAMGHVQADVYSEQDGDFAAALVAAGRAAAATGTDLGANTVDALRVLRGFRGFMGHTSLAPTLAYLTRHEFLRRVVAARVGDELARQYKWNEAPVVVRWLLATRPPQWLPAAYAGPQGGGWDRLLLDSLSTVVDETTLAPAELHWGRYETLAITHPVFSHLPVLRNLADLGPVEINGSRLTVKQAQNTWLGAKSDLGPSMRFVADLADWDRSTLTLVAGESGDIFSPHYRDQWLDYLQSRALPLWFSPAAVTQHARHRLQLTPGAAAH